MIKKVNWGHPYFVVRGEVLRFTKDAGRVELPRNLWKVYLKRIKKSCLTVFPNIQVIKEVIRDKMLFQLRLSNHGLEEERKLDRMIRAKVKEILHQPRWSSTDWIHSKTKSRRQ